MTSSQYLLGVARYAAAFESLFWDSMVTNSFEVESMIALRVVACFAASRQCDFDLSNVAQFFDGRVVGALVSCNRCELMFADIRYWSLVHTRSVLCKGEPLERGDSVPCLFWPLHKVFTDVLQMRGEDRSLDRFAINRDKEPDSVCRITVSETVAQVQSNVEFGASDRLHECRCAQVAVLDRVLDEWHAVHADGDGSTGEAVGVHGESGAV